MRPPTWSLAELVEALAAPVEPDFAGGVVLVDGGDVLPAADAGRVAVERLATLPCVVVAAPGWHPTGDGAALVDVFAGDEDELAAVWETVARVPVAATALALHLRASGRRGVGEGLVAESSLYSALQAGPEHRRWRSATPVRARRDAGHRRVHLERAGGELHITLVRPDVRNALDVQMRDELLDALAVAEADPGLRVVLRGDGPSFCAGGDLDEFGTGADPATAHLVRLRRSIGAVLHRLSARTTVFVHGACAGSGVELAAFAGRVVSHPDAMFMLPELGLGLVPGAGGTVSLPRRIGRHRTAWLALTGRAVGAGVARSWRLVDEIALF